MRAVAGRAAARALVGALALAAAAAVLAADGAVDEEAVAPDSTVLSTALGWGAWCLWGVWWLVWVLITTILTYICLPWLLVRRTNFPSLLCCCLLRHQSAPYPAATSQQRLSPPGRARVQVPGIIIDLPLRVLLYVCLPSDLPGQLVGTRPCAPPPPPLTAVYALIHVPALPASPCHAVALFCARATWL